MSSSRSRKPGSGAGSPRIEEIPDDQLEQQLNEKVKEEIKLGEANKKKKAKRSKGEEEEDEEMEEAEEEEGGKKKKKGKKSDDGPQADPYFFDFESLEKIKATDRKKRMTFLLNQTELFKHFLSSSNSTGQAKKILNELMKSLNTEEKSERTGESSQASESGLDASKSPQSSRRHRKTEKDEDQELIAAEETEESNFFRFSESPSYIEGTMRDYQIHGLNWMISLYENGLNGILADEMGLGKSLQTISLLGYLKNIKNIPGPHLVVVPKSTLLNWNNEFAKWCPSIKAFVFHGDKDERAKLADEYLYSGEFDVCVTSYEMILLEKSVFKKFAWHYIVIDEAHRIKNENSMLSQIMRLFISKNRLLVTGTPLQNNLHELWALLNFLLPDVFGSAEDFDSWFTFQSTAEESEKENIVKQLHKVLKPFLLRRLKNEVEKSLKPKKEVKLYIPMTKLQRDFYQKLLMKDIDAINGALGKREGKTRLLNIVMQLRKCCNHPYLFDGVEPGPPFTTDLHIIQNAGKMTILDNLLKRVKENGSRVLLFSQMSRMLDILEDYCLFREYKYCRLDGQTDHEERQNSIEDFNRPDSDKFLFMLTTRAGGLGINLATADVVILYDSDWNPQVDLQAQDRAHRIGQKKQVMVYRFVTENSVEEKMIEKAEVKLRLDQVVIQQGRVAEQQKAASKDELLNMIQYGAQDILQSKDAQISNIDDLDAIIQKGEKKTAELESKLKEAGLDALQNFSLDGQSSVYEWDGMDWRDKRAQAGMAWIEPSKRERKQNYNIDEYYRDALNTQRGQTAPRAPKPPKQQYGDYQFFPRRVLELQEKEIHFYRKSVGYKIPKASDDADAKAEANRAAEQEKIDSAEALTEEELAEKESLLEKGFSDWTKKDFTSFIKGCEKYGRESLPEIASEIEGKTLDEVKKYSKVFWSRYKELADQEKFVAAIERGEDKLQKKVKIQDLLNAKVNSCKNPLQQMKLSYGQNKGKFYTEEEDRFMICALKKHGYGEDDSYEKIRQDARHSPSFRFDWFLKSRTAVEINRRCNTLIGILEKESNLEEDDDDKKGKKRKPEEIDDKKKKAKTK